MSNLRVMSWNIQTFSQYKTLDDFHVIHKTAIDNKIDILCIQEIQIGHAIDGSQLPGRIDTPVGPDVIKAFDSLTDIFNEGDAKWNWFITGANKGLSPLGDKSAMRDAYAFLFLNKPSDFYKDPNKLDEISGSNSGFSGIIPSTGDNWYKGTRRPGICSLSLLKKGTTEKTLNVVSFHACVENKEKKIDPADAIRYLTELPQIGGGFYNFAQKLIRSQKMPDVSTVVLGDFNVSYNPNVYYGLKQNYVECIDMPVIGITGTTYSRAKPVIPVTTTTNFYDNIFLYSSPKALPFKIDCPTKGNPYDFISDFIPILKSHSPSLTDDNAFWNLYGGFHKCGVSDHLPVFAEFVIS